VPTIKGARGETNTVDATVAMALPGALPVVWGYTMGSHHRILLDTGATHNMMPSMFYLQIPPMLRPQLNRNLDISCQSATGDPITLEGWADIRVNIGFFEFITSFIVADVTQIILGNDFFREYEVTLQYEGNNIKLFKKGVDLVAELALPPPDQKVGAGSGSSPLS